MARPAACCARPEYRQVGRTGSEVPVRRVSFTPAPDRPRCRSPTRIPPAGPRGRGSGRTNLPEAGWHTPCAGAGRRAGTGSVAAADRRPPERSFQAPDHRQPRGPPASPDLESADRLELRQPVRSGAEPLAPSSGLRWRLDPGGRGRSLREGCSRPARLASGQVTDYLWGTGRTGASVSDAGDRTGVRARETARERGRADGDEATSALLPAAGRGRRGTSPRTGSARLVWSPGGRA